jgi:tRNA/tmRNA/rRNA uracil-C5-methylase (TrmA/RlmC/RlmD family)
MIRPGATLTLGIEKPAAGGRMLGRHEGQVVLVSNAIPGEQVRARVERASKGMAFAEAVEILTPSPDRRPATDWRCGGNLLAHIAYERQLAIKGEIIRDAFGRIAKAPLAGPPAMIG